MLRRTENAWRRIGGHFWTIAPTLVDRVKPVRLPKGRTWTQSVPDDDLGEIALTGELLDVPQSKSLVIVVHGLGGCIESGYVVRFAHAAHRLGHSVLRLNVRGADRSGQDIYNAGLSADIHAALAHPEVTRYDKRYLVGFSMGGHVSLRALAEGAANITAAAAICSPLDLAGGCAHIDHPLRTVYRNHVLSGLREILAAVPRERRVGIADVDGADIRKLRDWDELVVAPRFGFAGADDYYAQMSAGPVLGNIETPTLYLGTEADPMIPAALGRPYLDASSPAVESLWIDGGHVGFSQRLGVWDQVLSWLARF